ncbi:SCO family protein [Ramlibacter alkalitolerans]|uniref:SCO family protein n=1 Tax=Ramlibacter alkalitolerans TaxID=2039631 RepID=A0ABS1JH68_9BURK|nr:SCO family protein [Ramlibacter alkalitolerans]
MLTGIWWTAPGHAANGSQASPWGANYFPNVPLVTQDHKTVRFFDDLIKGKVVVINFIFTGCSAACGMETARLRQVQDLLGDRVGKDVFFYSISIDPENDTPEALKAYMAKFNVAPGWTFLTGKQKDIDLLRARLGLYMPPINKDNPGVIDHDLAVIVGNQLTGRWQKASPMENPEVLATQVGSWLSNWKVPPKVANPKYENAPVRLPTLSKGEELFRTRCVTCHTVGQPGTETAKSIGPDLTHVTRVRQRGWLVRWLKEPDAVLAAKDPIAVSLYEKYNKLAMPNLKLSEADVEAVLSFLEQGSAAFQAKK